MRVQVAKWGNSLAVRIPVECAREVGMKAGDALELEVASSGDIRLIPAPDAGFDKAAFLGRLDALHAQETVGAPVVEAMRREARY